MTNLCVSLLQYDIIWEQPQKNREMFQEKILALTGQTNLIILPEMFSTGFTMNARQFAETMQGATLAWMQEMAFKAKADLVGSVIIHENGNYFNRLLWVKAAGRIQHYDKRHLFRMAGEDKVFSAGRSRIIVELNGWKILPLICYDLRFPVWARNHHKEYDLLVYIANWPERRIRHWDILLKSRAIENQCYVAGVNRIGEDGNGINHTGQSVVFDYLGNPVSEIGSSAGSQNSSLSPSDLKTYREKFPAWKDIDEYAIN